MTGIFNGIQKLFGGIQTLINGVKMAIQFLIGIVKTTFELLKLLATTIGNATTLITTLPPWLTAFATATIGIAVIYVIIGRETGK